MLRHALRTVVRTRTYPLHLRLRALDVLVASLGDYDTRFLRQLARASEHAFDTEVLGLAAVCALSRCPSKDALHELAYLVGDGPEWISFQSASHLRYVAGLRVPPLVAMSDRGTPGVIESGDWIDVAHWLVDREERQEIARQLHDQIRRLPADWPWHDIRRLEPLLLHKHPDARRLDPTAIPDVVKERSNGEDVFWVPYTR